MQIKGKLANYAQLRNPVWEEARDPKNHGFSFREPVPTVGAAERGLYPHLPTELCVALLGGQSQNQRPLAVRLGGGRTMPTTVVVPLGTLIRFENRDAFVHRLYGVGLPTFPAADTTPQGERKWSVQKVGTFEFRDEAAPSVRFWVVGAEHVAASSYPSMSGEFSLEVEQPGKYTLQAYFAGKAVGAPVPLEVTTRDIDLRGQPIKVFDPSKAAASDEKDD